MRKILLSEKSLFVILILFCIPSIFGLLHPGFFVSDDGNWMVIRFSAFYEAFRHGQFPVRFLPRLLNGYGYPVADFLYPLFMYVGVPIHIAGINFVNTIKIIFFLSLIGSGIFTFLWLKKLFSTGSALVGAFTFVYFPYHLFDLYKRGSIGEVLALCFVPFTLWQIERKSLVFTGLGIGLLILSHNTLALMMLPIILIYCFVQRIKIQKIGWSLLLGLGLSAFFWLPALLDKQYTVFDSTAVANFSQYFLFFNNWYIAGFISILAIGLGIIGIVKKSVLAILFEIILLISLILTSPFSHFVWQILPLGKYVQFPFRFLSVSIVASSYLIAYGLSKVPKKYFMSLFVFCILIVGISAIPVILPTSYQTYPDSWYSTNQDSTTVHNEYLPVWVNTVPTNKSQVATIIKGSGSIPFQSQNSSKISLQTIITKNAIVQINTIYFPGWVVKVDGKTTSIVYANPYGLVQIAVGKGMHTITASFGETPWRLIADIVSLGALLSMGVITLVQYTTRSKSNDFATH